MDSPLLPKILTTPVAMIVVAAIVAGTHPDGADVRPRGIVTRAPNVGRSLRVVITIWSVTRAISRIRRGHRGDVHTGGGGGGA